MFNYFKVGQMKTRKDSGSALITVLAFTLVVSFLLAAVGTVSVSTLNRANVEGDYASAVSVADAGINAVLRRISSDPTNTALVNSVDSPLTGTIAGVGSYSAYVEDYSTGGVWSAPNDMRIISTGTVNGVSRKVSARGARKSIFDEYAIFADEGMTLGGAGNNNESTQITGNVGLNNGSGTDATFNGNLGTSAINGELTLNDGATANSSGGNVVTSGDRVELPTVAEVANSLFGQDGLTWLASNNSNSKILKLKTSNTSLSTITTINGLTMDQVTLGNGACLFDSAGYATNTATFSGPIGSTPTSTNTNDSASAPVSTRRFATAAEGIQGLKTVFLPPGDYFFNSINLKGGTDAIVLLTHLGTVRIWISGSGGQDVIKIPVIFTDLTPSKFRLFYNKCSSLDINGNSTFAGGFYAVNPGCGVGPTMNFSGNSTVLGSVIASMIDLSGGTQIIFPNDGGGSDPTDYSLWFGTKNEWKELPINNGGPVFATGTSN
jgi:hypothetical protein